MDITQIQLNSLKLFEAVKAIAPSTEVYRYEQITTEFILAIGKLQNCLPVPFKRYLEIGCGDAFNLILWSQLAEEVHGADLPGSIALARNLTQGMGYQNRISLHESGAETLSLDGTFDVVNTQYVLEHVNDIELSLQNMRGLVKDDGIVIHTVPSSVSRSNWYIEYRDWTPIKRLAYSLWRGGIWKTLRNPFGFTPAHEPRVGDYRKELSEYRIDRWAMHIMRAGFAVIDYFQTEDINWVIVSRMIASSN